MKLIKYMKKVFMNYEPYHSGIHTVFRNSPMKYNAETLEWLNPEEIFACIVSLKRKYAQDLLDKGIMKFNSPENWIKYAIENSTGRGDVLEGNFETIKIPHSNKNFRWENHYSENICVAITKDFGYNLLHLKNQDVIKLPCYCFYIIRNKDFKIQLRDKRLIASAEIPSRYFRGLEDGRTWLEEQNLDEQERLVSVVIGDIEEFFCRIKKVLIDFGVEDNSIIMKEVEYEDLLTPYNKKREHPMELFVKNLQFSDQSEGRIVINTKNKKIRDKLDSETLSIE